MAEITTKESETGELEIFTTPPPSTLSAEQNLVTQKFLIFLV